MSATQPVPPDFDTLPERTTAAAAAFLQEEARLLSFVVFFRELAVTQDRMRAIALAALEADPDKRAELEAARDEEGPTVRTYNEYRDLTRQLILTRTVDNYLTYVSQMLGDLFRHRPEMLRSERQVKLDVVLKHESMDDLVRTLAEREVERLAYKGLDDLADELEKRFGMVLFSRGEQRALAVLNVERRNLIVHNRGIINSRWIHRVGDAHGGEGDQVDLGPDGPWEALVNFHNAVVSTDTRLVGDFALTTQEPPKHVPGAANQDANSD